jgi:hypothetical protein
MTKKRVGMIVAMLWAILPLIGQGSALYKPFIPDEYGKHDYEVSSRSIEHGDVVLLVREVKGIADRGDSPRLCRAWFEVVKGKQQIFKRYFDDIDAVGFSYGLFIPKTQPPSPFFAVVKNGDYDGRLFLVHKGGKVFDVLGGRYFMTQDKRYLFSEYVSDGAGLTVFDLHANRVVFSSQKLPYIHQWYVKDGEYFFTESEWASASGGPREKERVAHFYDFETNRIVEKNIESSEVKRAKTIEYDFNPREYEDCSVAGK